MAATLLVVKAAGIATASGVTLTSDSRRMAAGAYPATGLLHCPGGSGTGHLVGSTVAVLTAAHVVIGGGSSCKFILMGTDGPRTFPVDLSRMRAGSFNPRSEPASRDWAVVRLSQPVSGVRPYATAGAPAIGGALTLVSGRTLRAGGVMTEMCKAKARLPGPEIAIDCSAQSGDSGAALLSPSGQLSGIYVGYRSAAPSQTSDFSMTHYNFAIPVSPAIRSAIADISR